MSAHDTSMSRGLSSVPPHPLEKAATLQNPSPLTQSLVPARSLDLTVPECWQQKQGLEEALQGRGAGSTSTPTPQP